MVASRYGSATCPDTPVAPSRMRSPVRDWGDPAKKVRGSCHLPSVHSGGGSLNVRASVLTNMPASAPGAKLRLNVRFVMDVSFEPQEKYPRTFFTPVTTC